MRRFWFAMAALFAVTSVVPAQAQSPGKLKLAYVAPEECVFFLTWNGWTEADPKSANRTEKLFAEQSVKDFGNQLMDEFNKLINTAAALILILNLFADAELAHAGHHHQDATRHGQIS